MPSHWQIRFTALKDTMQVQIRRKGYYATGNFVIVPTSVVTANISSTAFRLLATYMTFANQRGEAWPSRNTLANLIRRSVDTIDRANEELVQAGFIGIDTQVRDNGSTTVNLVTIFDPEPINSDDNDGDGGRKNAAGGAVKMRPPELDSYELDKNIDTKVSIQKEPKKRGRKPLVRRTDGIDKLFIAFRSIRFPRANPDQFNPAELKANQTVLIGVYEGGVTPEQFALATKNALERWDNPAMVTVRSVARNLSSLLEERQQCRKAMSQADQRAEDARRHSEERLFRQMSQQNQWDQTPFYEEEVRMLDE